MLDAAIGVGGVADLHEDPGRLLPLQRLQRGKNSGPGLGGALDLFRVAPGLHAVGGEDAKLVAKTAGRGGGLRRGVRRSRGCGGGGGRRAGRRRRLRRGGPCLRPAKVVEDAFDGEPIEEGGRRRSRVAGSCGVGGCSLGNRGGSGREARGDGDRRSGLRRPSPPRSAARRPGRFARPRSGCPGLSGKRGRRGLTGSVEAVGVRRRERRGSAAEDAGSRRRRR